MDGICGLRLGLVNLPSTTKSCTATKCCCFGLPQACSMRGPASLLAFTGLKMIQILFYIYSAHPYPVIVFNRRGLEQLWWLHLSLILPSPVLANQGSRYWSAMRGMCIATPSNMLSLSIEVYPLLLFNLENKYATIMSWFALYNWYLCVRGGVP